MDAKTPQAAPSNTPVSGDGYKFSASYAEDAKWDPGLRDFFEYRDLGVKAATGGEFKAHILRVKDGADPGDLHTTGLHTHGLGFQMIYILKGWIKFVYHIEDADADGGTREEVHTFGPGDCCLQPPSILHNELECSDDLELIEITSPANYPTEAVGE